MTNLNSKTSWTILAIFAVIILVIVGYSLYSYYKNYPSIPTTNTTKTSTTSDDSSDWKSYSSEKYGYSIKYPQDWLRSDQIDAEYCITMACDVYLTSPETKEEMDKQELPSFPDLVIRVTNLSSEEFDRDILRFTNQTLYFAQQTVVIGSNNYSAVAYKVYADPSPRLYISLPHNNKLYTFQLWNYTGKDEFTDASNLYVKILSTLEFSK